MIVRLCSPGKLVERMQRLGTLCVKGLRRLRDPALQREIQHPSMQHHILRATLIMADTLFHGNLNLPLEEFVDAPAVIHLRWHQCKVGQLRFQIARRQAAFAVRVIGPWNRLPPSVAESPSPNALKERLDNFPGLYPIPFQSILASFYPSKS